MTVTWLVSKPEQEDSDKRGALLRFSADLHSIRHGLPKRDSPEMIARLTFLIGLALDSFERALFSNTMPDEPGWARFYDDATRLYARLTSVTLTTAGAIGARSRLRDFLTENADILGALARTEHD